MPGKFRRIGLLAKTETDSSRETFTKLVNLLAMRKHTMVFEANSAALLNNPPGKIVSLAELGKACDLAIVVGGDGSILNAARAIVAHNVPILGINRGSLGFMADIRPDQMQESLNLILDGNYIVDTRFMLETAIFHEGTCTNSSLSLNDAVLFNGDISRMIEFEVFVDNQFVMNQRSDGIIISTPTGSTAYSLSAGGSIMMPTLGVISLVPMFAHTLTSRPIIICDSSTIRLAIAQKRKVSPKLSCDGQVHIKLDPGDEIIIKKHKHQISLLHQKGYNYFALLREKLGWHTYVGSDRV